MISQTVSIAIHHFHMFSVQSPKTTKPQNRKMEEKKQLWDVIVVSSMCSTLNHILCSLTNLLPPSFHLPFPTQSFHFLSFLFHCLCFNTLLKMCEVILGYGKCGSTRTVRNKRNIMNVASLTEEEFEHFSFNSNIKASVIMMVLLVAVLCVLGDDTQALRDTLSSLCSLNQNGAFGSCCESHDINSVTLDSSETWNCFLSSLSSTSNSITYLFVIHMIIYDLHISRSFGNKGLSTLENGVFSSLTNLKSLFIPHFLFLYS